MPDAFNTSGDLKKTEELANLRLQPNNGLTPFDE
jgi:hypothetical protein